MLSRVFRQHPEKFAKNPLHPFAYSHRHPFHNHLIACNWHSGCIRSSRRRTATAPGKPWVVDLQIQAGFGNLMAYIDFRC
jgi:hypothetical protein